MPRPPERVGAIADELLKSFDRALELRAKIAKLEDELAPLEKRLVWTLMPAAFGPEHWGPHSPSPADSVLEGVRHAPIGGRQEDVDWPFQKADVKVLRAVWNEWKKRGKAA